MFVAKVLVLLLLVIAGTAALTWLMHNVPRWPKADGHMFKVGQFVLAPHPHRPEDKKLKAVVVALGPNSVMCFVQFCRPGQKPGHIRQHGRTFCVPIAKLEPYPFTLPAPAA